MLVVQSGFSRFSEIFKKGVGEHDVDRGMYQGVEK